MDNSVTKFSENLQKVYIFDTNLEFGPYVFFAALSIGRFWTKSTVFTLAGTLADRNYLDLTQAHTICLSLCVHTHTHYLYNNTDKMVTFINCLDHRMLTR